MPPDRSPLPAPEIVTITHYPIADSDSSGSASERAAGRPLEILGDEKPLATARSEEAQWVLTRDDQAEAIRFWKDVAEMWPKKWWNLRQHRQDFQLRLYAKKRIRELERQPKPNALKIWSRRSKPVAVVALALLAAAPSRALGGGAIHNWPAPASWSPSRSHGVTTQGDITNPLPFIGVTPCRQYDSRNATPLLQ